MLIIDVSRPFADASFFEIEQSLLDGSAHTTCGGRWLNDNVMDTLYAADQCGQATAHERRRRGRHQAGGHGLPVPGAANARTMANPAAGRGTAQTRPSPTHH
jgi:hypothetical protein